MDKDIKAVIEVLDNILKQSPDFTESGDDYYYVTKDDIEYLLSKLR